MEKDDPSLPPIKAMMMHSADGKGMTRWLSYYYTIPMFFFLFITIFVAILRHDPGCSSAFLLFSQDTALNLLIVFVCIQAAIFIWVQFNTSKVTPKQRAGLFGDEEFEMFFKGDKEECQKKFGKIINDYHDFKTSRLNV